jgi:hypothetical protein
VANGHGVGVVVVIQLWHIEFKRSYKHKFQQLKVRHQG